MFGKKKNSELTKIKNPNKDIVTPSIEKLGILFKTSLFSNLPELLKPFNTNTEARSAGKCSNEKYSALLDKYSIVPNKITDQPSKCLENMVKDLFGGIPLWRSPLLQYNVGAAVNPLSSALYSASLDLNIFNINDGLSGNTVIAEQAVTRILSNLAEVDSEKSYGIFTFGGTATNLYAVKLGLSKCFPNMRKDGLPGKVKIVITEDAHFSHANVINWLGIGTKNTIVIPANSDRTSNILDAEAKIRRTLNKNIKVPVIIINGGTTYDNVIDDIKKFAELRDNLVEEYKLEYKPHIHVDSVIGWTWLFFKEYDFENNPNNISEQTLAVVRKQYEKICNLKFADSWGVDFHKGAGTCPVPTSVFMVNDKSTVSFLSYDENVNNHQLASEYSNISPADVTLETSRPAGAPLAALGAIQSLGFEGFQTHLANLIDQNQLFRKLIQDGRSDIEILNPNSPGYVTMIRLLPPIPESTREDLKINKYLKDFFDYDKKSRMAIGDGVEYSYSSRYICTGADINIAAIKFYPTSPFITDNHIYEAYRTLCTQKDNFDHRLISDSRMSL